MLKYNLLKYIKDKGNLDQIYETIDNHRKNIKNDKEKDLFLEELNKEYKSITDDLQQLNIVRYKIINYMRKAQKNYSNYNEEDDNSSDVDSDTYLKQYNEKQDDNILPPLVQQVMDHVKESNTTLEENLETIKEESVLDNTVAFSESKVETETVVKAKPKKAAPKKSKTVVTVNTETEVSEDKDTTTTIEEPKKTVTKKAAAKSAKKAAAKKVK